MEKSNSFASCVLDAIVMNARMGEIQLDWVEMENVVREARGAEALESDNLVLKASWASGVTRKHVDDEAEKFEPWVVTEPYVLKGLHPYERRQLQTIEWPGLFPSLPYIFDSEGARVTGRITCMHRMRRVAVVRAARLPARTFAGGGWLGSPILVTFWSNPESHFMAHSAFKEHKWGSDPERPITIPDSCGCRACHPDSKRETYRTESVAPLSGVTMR